MDSKLDKFERYTIHRPALGVAAPIEYPNWVLTSFNKLAPTDVQDVVLTCGCRSSANENAIKLAFLHHYYKLKGNDNITEKESKSVLENQGPGVPKFKIIGFEGGNHGNLLSVFSNFNNSSYNNFPSYNWPVAPFPNLKYPYNENEVNNRKEEDRCIDQTEKLIKSNENVCAMIIEPLQIQGGFRYASSLFYNDLIDLCYKHNITFICDETQTSGWAGGRPFIHTNWNSEKPVHIVTFAGRMQASGLFMQRQFRAKHSGQIMSTWTGDILKLQMLRKLFYLVHEKDWIDTHSSQFMQSVRAEMNQSKRKFKFKVHNTRGIGKMFAFDVDHKLLRDEIVQLSIANGFKVNPQGSTTIGFTPSLLFAEFHFAQYVEFLTSITPTTVYMNL
jgi:4-aminobutyrate aminotransferase/(S)-3-amino-2-methylpropionate transaminase